MDTRKKIIIILFIFTAIGVAGILVYKKNQSKKNESLNVQSFGNGNTTTVSIDKIKQEEFDQALKKIATTDQDFDGIPDVGEAAYKTDPASADTDGDGLTDWQEISIYKTDPLKADTDGDTFADGYEVRHGFNPKGKGKL